MLEVLRKVRLGHTKIWWAFNLFDWEFYVELQDEFGYSLKAIHM